MPIPTTMKAARIHNHGGPETLVLEEVPTPTAAEHEVLVQVSAVALNNTDLWTREGAYGLAEDPQALAGWRGPLAFPRVQGADVAGHVVQTPKEHRQLLGSRVLIDPAIYASASRDAEPVGLLGSERDGGYAEYVAVPADAVHQIDNAPLTGVELAALPTAYGTAMGMLERASVSEGETVVVTGASGGVGVALIQLAVTRGAHVIAISSGSKVDAVRVAGAHVVLDRKADAWEEIQGEYAGKIDVVLDVVAGGGISQGLSALRDGGRWVVAGALGGYEVPLDIRRLYLHNITLLGSSMHTREHFAKLVQIAREGGLKPLLAGRYKLEEIHQAQADLADRNHVGKLVVSLQGHLNTSDGERSGLD